MKEQSMTTAVDLEKVRNWVSVVDPYFLAIRPSDFFEEMGFPAGFVRKCVRKYRVRRQL